MELCTPIGKKSALSKTSWVRAGKYLFLLGDLNCVFSTITREHIPKKHLDFENAIVTDKVFDNTNGRIYGERLTTSFVPTSNAYGTGRNAADQIPRVGQKSTNFEAEIAAQIAQEIQDKADEEERVRQ